MPKSYQSIEDLIDSGSSNSGSNDSAQIKFEEKQKEIKIKEVERAAQNRAASSGFPYVNLIGFAVSPDALTMISEEDAQRYGVVCFYYDGKNIRLASVVPESEEVERVRAELEKKNFAEAIVYLVTDHSFEYALRLYKNLPKVEKVVRGVVITEEDLGRYSDQFSSFKDLQDSINGAQTTEIVTMMIAAAVKANSSDIHIEGEEAGIVVRFRIDGILHEVARLNKGVCEKVMNRMKLLTGVKLNIADKPQDGRTSIYMTNDRIDVRASFLPTAYGESVVMRLLRSSSVGLEFEHLGIRGSSFDRLKKEVERPNGMIITTGPTGSGKTTTLYAILKKLNTPDTKIITIEDPIEYQLKGVNQSQTSEKYTFAQGLRSIVRQDPDIIMVGEIRDLETAEIAIQAALTGHLVLSTIHTNDAAGTIPRFLSMGAKPFLLAPALNAMIGQRLVRIICPDCKIEDQVSDEDMKRVRSLLDALPDKEKAGVDIDKIKFYKGTGCQSCQGIGYRGRIGIYEIMAMNEEIEKLVLSGQVSEYDMRRLAAQDGMITMVQDGILKALDGITSLEEVFRVAE